VYRRLLSYIRPYWAPFTLSVIFMVVVALSSGFSMGMISPLVNAIFQRRESVSVPATPSSLFRVDDIKDPALLASQLKDPQDPLSHYVRTQLSHYTVEMLDSYDGSGSPSPALQNALVHDLNHILQGTALYDERRFSRVVLSEEALRLIEQNPRGEERIRLNRILLEEAYPQELVGRQEATVPGKGRWPDPLLLINRWILSVPPEVTLRRLVLIIIGIFMTKAIFTYGHKYFSVMVEQGVVKDIRNQVYSHLHSLSMSFFDRSQVGVLNSRITNDVSFVRGAVGEGVITLFRESFMVVAYMVVILWASWRLAIVSILVVPLSTWVIQLVAHQLRKKSTRVQEAMAAMMSTFTETISGIRVVKAFSMEEHEIGKFRKNTWDYFKSLLRFERTGLATPPLTEFLGTVAACIILWYGGRLILVSEALSPDRFAVFLAASLSLMHPIKAIAHANTSIQQGLAAAARIFEVIDTKPKIADAPESVELSDIRYGLEFSHVSFAYEPDVMVLSDINLRIDVGDVVALVGPSGAGKSTLADLACRFYDPAEGLVTIDGIDLRHLKLESLRRLMGVVTQETILFNDTVRNNIAYGKPDTPLREVETAARAANAHRFIKELPQGYDTVIGERGVLLSGGERQRIAIARAILKNPPLLILDEATSSLDSESEQLVQEALQRLMEGRTSIVIAHRLSTIQNASRIVVLEEGRIVEEGTHEDLLAQDGLYRHLFELQFGAVVERAGGGAGGGTKWQTA
jgi:subfamily B ATP-binding cassette protein MsbA